MSDEYKDFGQPTSKSLLRGWVAALGRWVGVASDADGHLQVDILSGGGGGGGAVTIETPAGDSVADEVNDALRVNIVAGGGAGGTSSIDDTGFTPGASSETPAGGVYQSTPDTVDDGDTGALRMTVRRALVTTVETPAGDSAIDDVNDAVRVNVVAGGAGGGLVQLQVKNAGGVDTDVGYSAGDEEVPVNVVGALPAGNNNIGDVDVASLVGDNADLDTDPGVDNHAVVAIGLPNAGGHVVGGTATNPLRTDPTGTTAQPVTDNGASLTVDGPLTDTELRASDVPITLAGEQVDISDRAARDLGTVDIAAALPAGNNNIGDVDVASVPAPLNVVGPGAEATALRVTLANDSTGLVSVDDGGASLTVDGPLTDAQLRASDVKITLDSEVVVIDDGGGSITVDGPLTDAQLRATDVPITLAGETVDISDRAARDLGTVDIAAALPAGNNNIGDVDVASIAAGDNNIGNVDLASAIPAGTNLVGKVSAGLDTTNIYDGTTALTPKYAIIDAATSGDNTIVAAVASKKIRVLQAFLIAAGTTTVRFESGAGGTALTGQMSLIANVGFVLPFSPVGWFETASNTLLNLELSAAVSVDGVIAYVEV